MGDDIDGGDASTQSTEGAALAAAPDPAAGGQERERTLDEPALDGGGVGIGTSCHPDVCQLGVKVGTWAGHDNFQCPRCGYATIDADAVSVRNPNRQQ